MQSFTFCNIKQVNAKDDEIAQIATDYTPAEIAFFKLVVRRRYAPRAPFNSHIYTGGGYHACSPRSFLGIFTCCPACRERAEREIQRYDDENAS